MEAPRDPQRPAVADLRSGVGIATTLALLFPLLVVVAIYGQWLVSWGVLGHPPRPMLDDPKDVPYTRALNTLTGVLILVFPVAFAGWPLAIVDLVRRPNERAHLLARFAAFAALWVGAFWLLRADPWDVVEWWFD